MGRWCNTGGRSQEIAVVADSVISNIVSVEGCTADSIPDRSLNDVRADDGAGGGRTVGTLCGSESKGISERRGHSGSFCGALMSKVDVALFLLVEEYVFSFLEMKNLNIEICNESLSSVYFDSLHFSNQMVI